MYAVRDMIYACAIGRVILGDKEEPGKTMMYNADHVPDIVEVGADKTGKDVIYEIKVPSVTRATGQIGRGSRRYGGSWGSVGHHHGFGNTDERFRIQVFGAKGVGKEGDDPFDHKTCKGWIKAQKGDYNDALAVKHNIVKLIVVESGGGIAPLGQRAITDMHKRAKLDGARDKTKYSHLRMATKSFKRHWTMRIVQCRLKDLVAMRRWLYLVLSRAPSSFARLCMSVIARWPRGAMPPPDSTTMSLTMLCLTASASL